MSAATEHPVGVFCWFDLATTDAAAARTFYAELLGLSATALGSEAEGDGDVENPDVYTVLHKDEKTVCALYSMSQEMRDQDMPAHWLSYVSVDSVDASVDNVETLGGTVMQAPLDVPEAGRMAVVRDPGGALFALWEARGISGAELTGAPGTPCWSQLHAAQDESTEDFYGALLGWSVRAAPVGEGDAEPDAESASRGRSEFHLGELGVGGLSRRVEGGEGKDAPPGWTIYFRVEDCDATVERAKSLGAGLIGEGPVEIAGLGRGAFLRDPQGATFAVLAGGAEPAREDE